MNHKKIFMAVPVFFLFLFSAHSTYAKRKHHKNSYSPKEFKQKVMEVKRIARRNIASVNDIDENTALSFHFRNIRNSFIGGALYDTKGKVVIKVGAPKSSFDIHNLLQDLNKKFQNGAFKKHNDAQFLASQLLILTAFRGFVFRSKNIFDTRDGNARAARNMAITALRTLNSGIATYLPRSEWDAAFEYVIEPYGNRKDWKSKCSMKSWDNMCKIENGNHLQIWLQMEVLPHLVKVHSVLKNLLNKKTHIYWDNKILFGISSNFQSDKDRFLRLGTPEQLLLLSGTELAMSGIHGMSAFKLDGLFESLDSIGKKLGMGTVFKSEKARSKSRWSAIRKHKNLFKYKKTPQAKQHLTESYDLLKASLQNAHLAERTLSEYLRKNSDPGNFINPHILTPFKRIVNTGFNNAYQIVGMNMSAKEISQGTVISNVVNGEKVTVNLKKFFTDPPRSLQDFMPIGFTEGREHLFKNGMKYRNYAAGNPNAWNYTVYKKYFPNVKSSEDVRRTARVMAQSWGGAILGLPLGLLMY